MNVTLKKAVFSRSFNLNVSVRVNVHFQAEKLISFLKGVFSECVFWLTTHKVYSFLEVGTLTLSRFEVKELFVAFKR